MYNAIIRRPTLNQMNAITSTYHLLIRFSTDGGVGEVKGDQATSRECYITFLRDKGSREALAINDLECRVETQQEQIGPMEGLPEGG